LRRVRRVWLVRVALVIGLGMTGGTIFATDTTAKVLFFVGLVIATAVSELWGVRRDHKQATPHRANAGAEPEPTPAAPGSEAERLHLAERPRLGEALRGELEKGVAI